MKKILYFLLFVILSPTIFAQKSSIHVEKAKYKVGDPYKVVDAKVKEYFAEDGEMMAIKIHGRKVFIQKFRTSDMSFISEKSYKDMPKGFDLERIVKFNQKYYVFYSIWDKKNKTEQLFCKEVDFKSGDFVGEEISILKVKGWIRGTFIGLDLDESVVQRKFDFYKSFDESKLLITYRMKPEEKKDAINKDKIGMFVFDTELSELWGDEVKMPYTEKVMDNIGYSVDKGGNAYILARVYDEKVKNRDKRGATEPNYHIEILRIPTGSTKVKSSDIDKIKVKLGDMFVQEIRMYEGPDENIICAGYYTEGKNWVNGATGVFQFKIGPDGDIYDQNEYEFPLELLNQYKSVRAQEKTKKKSEGKVIAIPHLELRNFRIGKDGSILIIGEQYQLIVTHYRDANGNSHTSYDSYYDDIIITKINADGELVYMKYLPKRQHSNGKARSGMSYAYLYDEEKNKNYLVFLDNVKNINLNVNKEPARHEDGRGGFLTAYSVADEDGEVSKISILDTKDADGVKITQFSISRIFITGTGEFGLEAYKKQKEDVLVKVELRSR